MTTLQKFISELTDLSNPDGVYHDLVDKNQKVIVYDGEQSIAAIEKAYGSVFAITLVATMKAVLDGIVQSGEQATADYLSIYFDRVTRGIGLNFSDDTVQARMDSLSGYLGQDTVDKLKALGSVYKSKWELLTSEAEPSIEDITIGLSEEQTKRDIFIWVNYVKNGILSNNGNGKSISELKALIAERE